MLGTHRGRGNFTKDEGREGPAVSIDELELVLRVASEIFAPVDVCEHRFVKFQKVLNERVVEDGCEPFLVARRSSHDGEDMWRSRPVRVRAVWWSFKKVVFGGGDVRGLTEMNIGSFIAKNDWLDKTRASEEPCGSAREVLRHLMGWSRHSSPLSQAMIIDVPPLAGRALLYIICDGGGRQTPSGLRQGQW